ncbi:MAG: fibronectin type III domain-containing protein [Ignavibacteria bacterium]
MLNKLESRHRSGNGLTISSMSAAKGDLKGEVDLNWDGIEAADSYVIECCNGNIKQQWILVDITNESKYTIKGLKPNKIYSFRVAAVNSEKQGPWSEPIKKRIT